MDKFKTIFSYIKLLHKYNTLKNEHEVLKEQVKNKCFNEVLRAVNEPKKVERYRKENKRLRLKIKELKSKEVLSNEWGLHQS